MSNKIVEYKDLIAFHPGQYVSELIEDYNVTQKEFAKRLGVSAKTVNKLVNAEESISKETAHKLAKLSGVSMQTWLNLQNAYEAYEKVFRLNPYSIDDFLLAHRLLTQDLVKHPGQFRLGDVGIFDGTGKVVHLGARPQFVPNLVSDLFAWAKASQISDIVKSCIVHFELEIIHPFEDGNGRMGRMWQSLILSRWNPLFEWLPVESVIYRHQSGYYQALTESNEANDSTKFIQFMLEAILETLLDYSQQKKDSTEKSVKLLLKPRELDIFEKIESYLVENYQITTAVAQELTGLSAATMRRYLQIFVNQGLLEKSGTTKNTLYSLIIRS